MSGFTFDEENENVGTINADVASAAAHIVDNAPPVSEHVPPPSSEDSDSASSSSSDDVDSSGAKFDPALHASGADGKGVKTSKGLWRKKKGTGSRIGTGTRAASRAAAEQKQKEELTQSELAARAKMAGQVAAMSQFMVCSALFGPEWKALVQVVSVPDGLGGETKVTLNELEEQSALWANWMLATGRTDFPPGIALTLGILSYASRRFTMPETQRRAGKMKEWFAAKIAKWRVRRAERKNASTDTRANSQRQDNVGANSRESVSVPARA